MRIGLDIDDTMTNSAETIREYAAEYFKGEDLDKVLDAPSIDGKLLEFLDKNLAEMSSKYTLKDNVKEVLDRLKEKGHEIIIITARSYTPVQGNIIEVTLDHFKKNDIVVDDITFKALEKTKICIEKQIDIMIDDSIKVLEDLEKSGIDTLLFTTAKNKDKETHLKRVKTWLEIEEYIDNRG